MSTAAAVRLCNRDGVAAHTRMPVGQGVESGERCRPRGLEGKKAGVSQERLRTEVRTARPRVVSQAEDDGPSACVRAGSRLGLVSVRARYRPVGLDERAFAEVLTGSLARSLGLGGWRQGRFRSVCWRTVVRRGGLLVDSLPVVALPGCSLTVSACRGRRRGRDGPRPSPPARARLSAQPATASPFPRLYRLAV